MAISGWAARCRADLSFARLRERQNRMVVMQAVGYAQIPPPGPENRNVPGRAG